ncbi:putative ammonium transporter 2 isoform X2 [Cylas formicarius]|uniref:putative ammonium transporter 2 isoform X2 n=1 Tax=Cylas formicarius TaxID=197179 RepID=UPI002958C31E|nr:putative ammonium transporter 2 isoform X2 [Cylas formicarius]
MIINSTNATGNRTYNVPALFNIGVEDSNWIITSSFMIFTMQTGFGMLESGCVSIKNEVNIMMKNVVDIVLGGLTYWAFGFAMSFGRADLNNGFIALGDFFIDPTNDDPFKGSVYTAFIFQLSFATTATTIVSGAMAERCNFKAYCIFSFLNTSVYCIPAGWIWGEHGFLKRLGAVDIAGSGVVHLIGGSAALASAFMLGPRLGRYDNGIKQLPLGNPVNAVMGLFVLWWGWLAFNSGSTYGLSGAKWHYAAKAAVMTMMSSFGGGTASIIFTMVKLRGRIDALDIINGILGSLVSITAGCFLYQGWEAIFIGAVGSFLVCGSMPLFNLVNIDDPVGASAVHGVGGIWGIIAVGIFASNPYPLDTTGGRNGIAKGGGWYLLGVQTLTVFCFVTWGLCSTVTLLWIINKIVPIRMAVHEELLGADLTEHLVKHPKVGVSRALSAFRPVYDTTEVENLENVGMNPGHDKHLNTVKFLATKKHYRMSKILKVITSDQNIGVKFLDGIFKKKRKSKTVGKKAAKPRLSLNNLKVFQTLKESNKAPMAWVN